MKRSWDVRTGLAVGCCLVLTGALAGCSSGNKGGNDAGNSGGMDSGMPDSGTPDSGTPDSGMPAYNGIGALCTITDQSTGASTCPTGDSCDQLPGTTLFTCTASCNTDSDCGQGIGGISNVCVGAGAGTSGECYQGCNLNETATQTCGSGNFVCLQYSSTDNICLPNCATQNNDGFCSEFYGYPFVVCDSTTTDQSYGECGSAGADCETGASACTTGQACYAIPDSDPADAVCVNDCNGSMSGTTTTCTQDSDCQSGSCGMVTSGYCDACPLGNSCDTSSDATAGTCQPTPVGNYEPCYNNGQCPSGAECVLFSSTQGNPGECLPACSGTSCPSAPSGSTATGSCEVPLGSNATPNYCALDCSSAMTGCPTGESCAQFNVGSSTFDWCIPQQDAE